MRSSCDLEPLNRRHFVKAPPLTIAYRRWGGGGTPVVLLHGIPTNSTLWFRTAEVLSRHGCVVFAPELLGLGYSDGPIAWDHSLRGQAALVDLFIRTVVGRDAILVGHDLGGGVAQILVTQRPGTVNKLVLTNAVAFDSWPVAEVERLRESFDDAGARDRLTPEFVSRFVRWGLLRGVEDPARVSDSLVEDIRDGLIGTPVRKEHFLQFLAGMKNESTRVASPQLRGFQGSALLVWARDDVFQPLAVEHRLRDVLPRASEAIIDGGHFHPLESTALAEAILEWDAASPNHRAAAVAEPAIAHDSRRFRT